MGLVKQDWLDSQERGWDAPEKWVCVDCVEDPYLKSVIEENVEATECSYCSSCGHEGLAAPVEVVLEAIAGAVYYGHNDPTQAGTPFDEGEFVAPLKSTVDVLLGLPLNCNDDLFEDICSAFHNSDWVRSAGGHWSSSHPHEVMQSSWGDFVGAVKHHTRFHFYRNFADHTYEREELAPSEVLLKLGRMIVEARLLKVVPAGTALYRCRVRKACDSWPLDAAQLGAPPPEKASAGRMNPAGISYLYTAFEDGTAFAETISHPPCNVVLSTFVMTSPHTVIDLSNLPAVPSIFDAEHYELRESLLFLEDFTSQISRPVTKDGSEHIDYVPSQVVCEYFAQAFSAEDGSTRVQGIIYPSAVRPSGRNLVFFPNPTPWAVQFSEVRLHEIEQLEIKDWAELCSALKL